MSLSVIILTFNAENTIGATLASAAEVSDDIHVVDSGSTDRTLAILAEREALIRQLADPLSARSRTSLRGIATRACQRACRYSKW